MCCLRYEHQTYVEARRRFPREGKSLRTSLGQEKVISVDIWGERVTLRDSEGGRRSLTLIELREDVARTGEGGPEKGPSENGNQTERSEPRDSE
jgi:cell fate regulator YaaT (PSP1 superfamily)